MGSSYGSRFLSIAIELARDIITSRLLNVYFWLMSADNDGRGSAAVFRSPAEDNGCIAAGEERAQLRSLTHAVLYRLGRTRICNRKTTLSSVSLDEYS